MIVTYLPFKKYILFVVIAFFLIIFVVPLLLGFMTKKVMLEETQKKESIMCIPPHFKEDLMELIRKEVKKSGSWSGETNLILTFPRKIGNVSSSTYRGFFGCRKGKYEGENINYLYCDGMAVFQWEKTNIDEEGNILKKEQYTIKLNKIILEDKTLNVVDLELECWESLPKPE